MYDLMQDLQDL